MVYYWIRLLHIGTVAFTIGFFSLRFYWMLYHPDRVRLRWVRLLSVTNDSLLLAAGISLAFLSHQYPIQAPWLTAKVIALLLYILLGTIALKRGKNRKIRILSGALSLLCAGYIVSVAVYRTPTPWTLIES